MMRRVNLTEKRANILIAIMAKIMHASPELTEALTTRFHQPNVLKDLKAFIQTGQPQPTTPAAMRWTFVRPYVLQFRYQNGYAREVTFELEGVHADLFTASRFKSWLSLSLFRDLHFTYRVAGDGNRLVKIPELENEELELRSPTYSFIGSRVFENFLTFDENLEEFSLEMDEQDHFLGLASSNTILHHSEPLL